MEKLTVNIPVGYKIDVENSDFEKGIINFKKGGRILNWGDIREIEGYFINHNGQISKSPKSLKIDTDKKLFFNQKYVEAALAFAQLSQVYQYYDQADYNGSNRNWAIVVINNKFAVNFYIKTKFHFIFKTKEEAQLFLDNNRELLEKFYMIK